MKKLLVLLLVLVPALLLIFVNAVYSAPPGPEFQALPSIIGPVKSFNLDMMVNIPDPALHVKLHSKTGVPTSQAIYASDLKALTGTLDLHGLGIADAEGLQYCRNVERIILTDNDLSAWDCMPDFSHMDGLHRLDLDHNGFTTVPSQLFNTPNLEYLSMNNCPITGVDLYIADLVKLKELDLSDTKMTEFPIALLSMHGMEVLRLDNTSVKSIPDDIDHMTGLKDLYMQNTGLKSIPSSISGLTHLRLLNVSNNKLESLPDSISSMSSLKRLTASYNNLYSLPGGIGNSGIEVLTANFNKISSLPDSIGDSGNLVELRLALNRLKSLPANFGDHVYDFIDLRYNFIDISSGAEAWTVLTDIEAPDGFLLKPQLVPVTGVTALAASDSITLSWQSGENGSNGAEWDVDGYVVYLYDGSLTKLADLGPSTLTYKHTGLNPSTEYSYRIGIDYHVVDIMSEFDVITRGYTSVSADTLAASALPAASAEPLPALSEETVSAVPDEPSAQNPEAAPVSAPGDAVPSWVMIVIIAVAAAGILGTGAALVILKLRKPKA